MRFLTSGLLLSAAVSATPFKRGYSQGPWSHQNGAKAVYFLDDDPSGSSIVSLKVGKDGHLSDPLRTSTNGFGAIGTNLTGFPNAGDPLMSQSAVVVSGDLLFTVNAGSNSLAMFRIDPHDPWHPQLVGSPADTMGDFPVSVAYSPALQTVCALNGGAVSGVACFNVDIVAGLKPAGELRSLAGYLNETTPASGPPGSAGQVIFDPGSLGVFALIKGNAGSTPPTPGSIVGFHVEHGVVSSEPIATKIEDLLMEFSAIFVSTSRMLVTDPSFGISILELGGDLVFNEVVHTIVPKQKAICWTEADFTLGTAYGIDAGLNKIWKFDVETGAKTGAIKITGDGNPANVGLFDSAIDMKNNVMYSTINGGNGVVAVDLKKEQQIQFLDLSSFGNRQFYQGMVIY